MVSEETKEHISHCGMAYLGEQATSAPITKRHNPLYFNDFIKNDANMAISKHVALPKRMTAFTIA